MFTTFGTGLSAIAPGLAYTPNWDQESNRIMALSQQMRSYYDTRAKLADDYTKMVSPAVIPNDADQKEYNDTILKPTMLQINKLRNANPGWTYDPEVRGQITSMAKYIQDNPITRRAEDLKGQKEALLKYNVENPGFLDSTDGRNIKKELDDRSSKGLTYYQQTYGKDEFVFAPPKKIDIIGVAKARMEALFPEKPMITNHNGIITIYNGREQKFDKNTTASFNKLVNDLIAEYPKQTDDYLNDHALNGQKLDKFTAISNMAMSSADWTQKFAHAVESHPGQEAYYASEALLNTRKAENLKPHDWLEEQLVTNHQWNNNPYLPAVISHKTIQNQVAGKPDLWQYTGDQMNVYNPVGKTYLPVTPEDLSTLKDLAGLYVNPTGANYSESPSGVPTVGWAGWVNSRVSPTNADEIKKVLDKYNIPSTIIDEMVAVTGGQSKATGMKIVKANINAQYTANTRNDLKLGYNAYATEKIQESKGPGFSLGTPLQDMSEADFDVQMKTRIPNWGTYTFQQKKDAAAQSGINLIK